MWSTMGENSRLDSALLATILPDVMSPIICDTNSDKYFLRDISTCIQNSDTIHDDKKFSRTYEILTVIGIHMRRMFLSSAEQQLRFLISTQVLDPISSGTLQ